MKFNKHLIIYILMIVIASILSLSGFMPKEVIKDQLLLTFGAGVALVIENIEDKFKI